MIRADGLSKTFLNGRRAVRAVDNVSFEVNPGEIVGILGPNGAGKTTVLRILATVLRPSSGTATVSGFDVERESALVRSQIGFLSGDMGLYGRLTPREIFTFFGKLGGLGRADLGRRVEDVIATLDLRSYADTRADRLSTGCRQRTAIGRSIIHNPPALILDEPSYGLDVPTARLIENFIRNARAEGKCIVFSTHVMEEAEYLCDRIVVIHEGRVRITGTMEQLRAATGKTRLREVFLELLDLGDSRKGMGA